MLNCGRRRLTAAPPPGHAPAPRCPPCSLHSSMYSPRRPLPRLAHPPTPHGGPAPHASRASGRRDTRARRQGSTPRPGSSDGHQPRRAGAGVVGSVYAPSGACGCGGSKGVCTARPGPDQERAGASERASAALALLLVVVVVALLLARSLPDWTHTERLTAMDYGHGPIITETLTDGPRARTTLGRWALAVTTESPLALTVN